MSAATAGGPGSYTGRLTLFEAQRLLGQHTEKRDLIESVYASPLSPRQLADLSSVVEIKLQILLIALLIINPRDAKEADYINDLVSCMPLEINLVTALKQQVYPGIQLFATDDNLTF